MLFPSLSFFPSPLPCGLMPTFFIKVDRPGLKQLWSTAILPRARCLALAVLTFLESGCHSLTSALLSACQSCLNQLPVSLPALQRLSFNHAALDRAGSKSNLICLKQPAGSWGQAQAFSQQLQARVKGGRQGVWGKKGNARQSW